MAKQMEALANFAARLYSNDIENDNDEIVDEGNNNGNKNNDSNSNKRKANNSNSSSTNGNCKTNKSDSTNNSNVSNNKIVGIKKKRKINHRKTAVPSSSSFSSSPVSRNTKRISEYALSGLTVPRKWDRWEDDELILAVRRYNCKNWKSIAQHVPGRNHVQCSQRWNKVLKPGLRKGQWDKEEDELLVRVYYEELARQKHRKQIFLKIKEENDKREIAAEEARRKEKNAERLLQLKEQQEQRGYVNVNTTTTTTMIPTNADATISTTRSTPNDVDKISGTGSTDLKLQGKRDALVSNITTNGAVELNNMKANGGNTTNLPAVNLTGNIIDWARVASEIQGRSTKQCRERWNNHLDPKIKRGNWSYEEDDFLLKEQARLGNKWSKIASMLEGRTENAVKIRWKSLTRVPKYTKSANEVTFDHTQGKKRQQKQSSSSLKFTEVGNPSTSPSSNISMHTQQLPNALYNVPTLTLQQQEIFARQNRQIFQQQQQQQLLLNNQMQKLFEQQQQQLLALHLLQQQQQKLQDGGADSAALAKIRALISSSNSSLLNAIPTPGASIAASIAPLPTTMGGISNMEHQLPMAAIGNNGSGLDVNAKRQI